MLVIPLALVVLAAIVLGGVVVASLWPVLVIWVAVLYCLGPRPSRKAEQVIGVSAVAASFAAYLLAPWHSAHESWDVVSAIFWLLGPLLIAAILVGLRGGPRRIRARRVRFEQAQAERRSEQARLAKAVRVAKKSDRAHARRRSIEARTGLDVDVVVEAARDTGVTLHAAAGRLVRVAGRGVTRSLAARQARRPPREPAAQGGARPLTDAAFPDVWLDLDVDIDSIKSHDRTEEILRLADELDGHRRHRLSRSN
ncbi:MAG: hypothetical protein ABI345_08160 [Jatrophihabitans sp.]